MKSSSKQNTITSFFSSSAIKKQKISDEQLNLSVTSTETEEIASSDALNLLGGIDSNVSINFDATTTYKSQSIRSCLLPIDTDALAADSASSPSVLSPTFIDTRASADGPASLPLLSSTSTRLLSASPTSLLFPVDISQK